jgi:hypothetical protein
MVKQSSIIQAFVKLGLFLQTYCSLQNSEENSEFDGLEEVINKTKRHNGWFTKEQIVFALKAWSQVLTEEKLTDWLANYSLQNNDSKNVAIIMAGNIPMVGFHDFLCVLVTNNNAICKLSSNDSILLPFIADLLVSYEPELKNQIIFVKEKLEEYDAVIATGSNNTSRYFEYYFGKKPNLIRKNRTSVAVLSGNESESQLQQLGSDIFTYYGLGCRNVSKLFVPTDYNFDSFFQALFSYKKSIDHHKYANNYDYNKAVYLMSEFKLLDNGFMILKEDKTLHSPISVVFYEYYKNLRQLKTLLGTQQESLQCIVANSGIEKEVAFGQTQSPQLNDYADGIDTVDFLLKL